MGAGKTTAARAAAAALGVEALDTDELVERAAGAPIAALFEREGEAGFRAREEAVAGELLERADGGAIALGGGALGSERIRAALARHVAILLDVDLDTAWTRAWREGGRPLAADRERFGVLAAERRPLYERSADAILPASDAAVVQRAVPFLLDLERAPAGTRLLWAHAASGDYPVFADAGLLAGDGPLAGERPLAGEEPATGGGPLAGEEPATGDGPLAGGWWPLTGRRFCVSDTTVFALHGAALGDALAHTILLEPGERSKTIAGAERVWRELARAGMTRADHVVALGGGVVGDLAGFCAATYQRGVAVVQVPTTLVAQVDAAYGGKTGVDLPEAKNYVGAYHQPAAVLVDPGTLATLPPGELAAGFVEVVKTALIAGGELWARVRAGADPADPDVVLACARVKLAVVAADERDAGRRQVLNLGHTVGHAIEAATGYARYRHGEAVALGLLAALRLSGQDALRGEVAELLGARGLPLRLEGADPDAVLAALTRDKKRRGDGRVPFVLVDAPGAVHEGRAVDDAALRAAVGELT
jgi:shikimate kinase/3-dehydroquinate synthase